MRKCKNCSKKICNRFNKKYCSNKCQQSYQRNRRIKLWLDNKISGIVGELTAKWIKKYLIQIRGEKCEFCGWNERNKYTNRVPVEIEHVDGKYKNNRIENLKLICPNCHSLTPTYRGLNRGKGRSLRRRRYIKNIK